MSPPTIKFSVVFFFVFTTRINQTDYPMLINDSQSMLDYYLTVCFEANFVYEDI